MSKLTKRIAKRSAVGGRLHPKRQSKYFNSLKSDDYKRDESRSHNSDESRDYKRGERAARPTLEIQEGDSVSVLCCVVQTCHWT